MKRAAPLAFLLLLLASAALAQHEGLGTPEGRLPGVPDVPEGPGTLRGRILHSSRPEAAAGLPVVLYALPAHGEPGLRGSVSDARGEFVFEGVSTDPATAYMVGVSFAEVPFGVRAAFAPGETERTLEIEISDPSQDASGVQVGELDLRFERGCGGLRVVESQTLANPGDQVIAIPPEARDAAAPVFETQLPTGATEFVAASGTQGSLDFDAGRVRYWGPIYPGSQVLEFSYSLPVEDGQARLVRSVASGASGVTVLTHRDGPRLRGEPPDAGSPDAQGWRSTSRGALAPGEELALSLEVPPAPAAAPELSVQRAQLWLELDQAALKVDERYDLETTGNTPLRSDSDAPLLCLPLPEGASELRFSTAALGMGLSRDASGALALRGPIPAGTSNVALSYLLPTRTTPLHFDRRFAWAVPWISLYVADTGLVADSPRLHRRRPVLTEDRTYMHLEGFALAPGESVALSLDPLPVGKHLPRLALAGALAVVAVAALAFLAAPLRRRSPVDEEPASPATQEREAIYAAIRDLDHDFETGKLSEEDYESFRHELRGRAVALLREERDAAAAPEPGPPADVCPGCGARVGEDARFCSQCGLALVRGAHPAPAS